MASDEDDWLKRIGRLLESDTVDLRALALAAGKNPATFYIGTNLDGVDMRGQDLRGMQLPGLDLDRVQRDEATLVDMTPQAPAEPSLGPVGLIWVAAGRDAAGRINLPFDVAVFGPEDHDEFIHTAQSFKGRPVVLLGSTTEIGTVARFSHRLAELAVPFVTVLDEPLPYTFDQRGRSRLARTLAAPVVIIPRLPTPWSRVQPVSAEAVDAAGLMLSEWEWRDDLLLSPTTFFVRARGIGVRRQLDAAAQISDRLEAEGLSLERGFLVRFRDQVDRQEEEGVSTLLESGPALVPHWGRRRNFDLALFVDPEVALRPSAYLHRTARALSTRGWETSFDATVRSAELTITNRAGSFKAFLEREPDEEEQVGVPAPRLPGVSFDAAERLILTPRTDISRISRHLVTQGQFLVTGRDLLALPSSSTSIWPIVAHQISQIGRTPPGRARDLYIRCVLASAFAQSHVEHSAQALLKAIADDPSTSSVFKLSLVTYKAEEGAATARLRIVRRSTAELVTEANLLIDKRGVHVSHPNPPPALSVAHESKRIVTSPLFKLSSKPIA